MEGLASNLVAEAIGIAVSAVLTYFIIERILHHREAIRWRSLRRTAATRLVNLAELPLILTASRLGLLEGRSHLTDELLAKLERALPTESSSAPPRDRLVDGLDWDACVWLCDQFGPHIEQVVTVSMRIQFLPEVDPALVEEMLAVEASYLGLKRVVLMFSEPGIPELPAEFKLLAANPHLQDTIRALYRLRAAARQLARPSD